MTDSAAQKRHRELVRLSYLILPGGDSQEARLALARRIVERNLPRNPLGPQAHAEARVKVFRQSMRPPRRLRPPVPRLRAGSPPGNAALAALTPEERVAYVLSRVAGLRRHVVREILADLGVPGSRELLERVDSMEDLRVVAPAAAARVRVRRTSRLPVLAACLATCALATVAIVQERDVPAAAVRTAEPSSAASSAAVPLSPPPEPREVRYWKGRLPGGAGPGELLCRHTPLPGGGFERQGMLVWRGESHQARDCSDGRTGLWWRSPAGRWFYLAASEPGTELSVDDGRRRGSLWTVRGPRGGKVPGREISLLKG
ncbi:hypothetical protein ABGB12_16160 [Actinocorallia sp. B10E7]|uniref:hypothetical protein n=1 Tax=Actinocorallia sp. B10E7 TaxID=3153558 RepID=UPI00325F8B89